MRAHNRASPIPSYRWVNRAAVAIDFEATGINASRDRILQYGVCGVDATGRPIELSAVVDAQTSTGRDPFLIPGVRKEQVYQAKPIAAHLDLLRGVCEGAIVICHKREFDWAMLEAEFRRNGLAPPRPFRVECTLRLGRTDIGVEGPHTLAALCSRFGIPLVMAHNALHDARATFRLYMVLMNRYPRAFDRDLTSVRSTHWPVYPWCRSLGFVPLPKPAFCLEKFRYG